MKLGVLFSGGKDSAFACYLAMKEHEVCCLISVLSENKESYMYHTPNVSLVETQAKVMGIPIIVCRSKGEKEKELDDLLLAVQEAVDKFGIEGIVTGAIESVYQATRVQKICNDIGLWCFNPLWKIDQEKLLYMLIDSGFWVIVSSVGAYPLDESWLGRVIDKGFVKDILSLKEKYGINPAGEGGEFETFVFDCPMFRKKIEIVESSKDYSDNSGVFHIDNARMVGK